MLTPFGLSGLLAGISSLLFGTLVFLRSRDRRIGRVWFIFTLTCAIWGFGDLGITCSHNPFYALWLWRGVYAFGANWIAPLFFHFVMIFTDARRRRPILWQYAIAGFFFLMAFTPWQYSQVQWFHDSYYCAAGRFYWLSTIWWLSLVLFSHYVLLRAYRTTSLLKKTQIKFFFLAMAFGFAGGVFDFLPPLGIDIYPWGNFTIFLYPLLMSEAILRYHLMDITIIIRKTLIYSTVTGALASIYFSIVTISAHFFQGLTGSQTAFSAAVAASLVTLCFQPLRKRIQTFVDTKFFRQYVDREQKLYELSREVITHTTPEEMAAALIRVLGDTIHPKFGALYLRTAAGTSFKCITKSEASRIPQEMADDNALALYFRDHPQPFALDGMEGVAEPRNTRSSSRDYR